MDKLNQDGNMLGRIGALAVIVAVCVGVAKVAGVRMCPLPSNGAACCTGEKH